MHENGAKLGLATKTRDLKIYFHFAKENGNGFTEICDLSNDVDIKKLIERCVNEWGKIDGIVHSVGFAPADQISGSIEESITREGFGITHDISPYSFAGLIKEAHPFMSENCL